MNDTVLMFDLGGVLIEHTGFDRLNDLLPRPLALDVIKVRWLRSPAVRSFELGSIRPPEFAERFVAEWQLPISSTDFLDEFRQWPKDFFPGARELIRSLRQTHRVACLSNSNELHWTRFNGFSEEFDVAMSSHLLGVIKPDRAAFARALAVCDAAARQTLFFDDSLLNVQAAQDCGIRGFQVDGVESLLQVLHNEGFTLP